MHFDSPLIVLDFTVVFCRFEEVGTYFNLYKVHWSGSALEEQAYLGI